MVFIISVLRLVLVSFVCVVKRRLLLWRLLLLQHERHTISL